ncbi:MAG TPA: hypothetical protein VGO68_21425 [Pyrinomonadaceae bacterium]|jgi:hypothetical protein|nr:hypothetical protein [Pyrinomonadaceae bacterium]
MEKVIELLNRMQADGVLQNFAIGGGIAFIYYGEPYLTNDIDVFISPVIGGSHGLVSFGEIYEYLQKLDYQFEGEYIRIEDWLVQFIPASMSVQEEAVVQARTAAFAGQYTRMFSREHLAAELLRSGRLKDHARVLSLIESGTVNMTGFRDILNRHGLMEAWKNFCAQHDLEGG